MKSVIRRLPEARRDLIEIFQYKGREAGLRSARRFLAAAESTFRLLAEKPNIGERYRPDSIALRDLRCLPVSRFKKYLVFFVGLSSAASISFESFTVRRHIESPRGRSRCGG